MFKLRTYARNIKYIMEILTTQGQVKYVLRWIESLSDHYLLDKPSPWITFQALDFIDRWINSRRDLKVFEYGSGGSTLYWQKFSSLVVSIEHDEGWYHLVQEAIQGSKAHDYRLILPERRNEFMNSDCDPADPDAYGTGDELLRKFSFYRYVTQIDAFDDHFFDVILIDGRSRPSCIKHSIKKIKPGGLLIVDNADTDYYEPGMDSYLGAFKKKVFWGVGPTSPAMWQTNIYQMDNPQ